MTFEKWIVEMGFDNLDPDSISDFRGCWNAALDSQLKPVTENPGDQDKVIMYLDNGGELFGRYIDGRFIEYNAGTDRYDDEIKIKFIKYWMTIPARPTD